MGAQERGDGHAVVVFALDPGQRGQAMAGEPLGQLSSMSGILADSSYRLLQT